MSFTNESQYASGNIQDGLAEVFKDAQLHVDVAKIVRGHLTQPADIRELALEGLDLSNVGKVIDLGCGFGFFTRGLKGLISSNAEITGIDRHEKYREFYLKACADINIRGAFIDKGITALDSFKKNSYDLALCSYALYFFPGYIERISELLHKDGLFSVITHSRPHMKEFTDYIKSILNEEGIIEKGQLPYESLIDNFSNNNGMILLSQYFRNIEVKKIANKLLFTEKDFDDFKKYFLFKHTFFIPKYVLNQEVLIDKVLNRIKYDLEQTGKIELTKEDIIFTCSK